MLVQMPCIANYLVLSISMLTPQKMDEQLLTDRVLVHEQAAMRM